MLKTILIIIISVTFFGVLFFIIVRNLLKRKLDQLVKEVMVKNNLIDDYYAQLDGKGTKEFTDDP